MEHLKQETVSGAQLNINVLYQICPQCFTESKDPKTGEVRRSVDFEKLRLLLGDNVAEGDERYDFTWVGKRAALQEAAKPIRKTLRPCPEESVDWENTKNLYIEGDNLEVLKLLQNSYMGKVKMIYIDPPYNTGNDFVYHDDFHQTKLDYDLFAGDVNEEGERFVKNTENNGRFHSDWCSMIYSRLMVARTLLSDNGAIFISIDDNEDSNMRKLCDEVFGESNFIGCVSWHRNYASANDAKKFSNVIDYVLVYSKSDAFSRNLLPRTEKQNHLYKYDSKDGRGRWRSDNLSVRTYSANYDYPIVNPKTGVSYNPPSGRCWMTNKETISKWIEETRVFFGQDGNGAPQLKRYLNEVQDGVVPTTYWSYDECGHNDEARKEIKELFGKPPFDSPKPTRLLKQIIKIGSDNDSLILDFFSGSSTTAHALMQINAEEKESNRRYIMVQWPELTEENSEAYKVGLKNICEIGKERIRRAGKKILEEQKAKQEDLFTGDQKKLDVGFRVFKCSDSNMKDVYYAPADYDQQMLFELEDNIKDGRNDLDLLFGCMLDWGVMLDLPLRTEKIDGVNIHIVNEGDLVACFEKHIPESVIDHIASLLPMRIVLRDSCFDEAKEKMNFFEIFKQRTGWSEEEVRKNVKVI